MRLRRYSAGMGGRINFSRHTGGHILSELRMGAYIIILFVTWITRTQVMNYVNLLVSFISNAHVVCVSFLLLLLMFFLFYFFFIEYKKTKKKITFSKSSWKENVNQNPLANNKKQKFQMNPNNKRTYRPCSSVIRTRTPKRNNPPPPSNPLFSIFW